MLVSSVCNIIDLYFVDDIVNICIYDIIILIDLLN